MQKGAQLYEGKSKIIFATDDPKLVIIHYKDDATAFNAQKKGTIEQKGIFNNQISAKIYQALEKSGVKTHLVEVLNDRECLAKKLEIIPIEVVVRNIAAGSICKRLGLAEGTPLKRPLLEFFYKDDALGDPMINDDHALLFNWASEAELVILKERGLIVNQFLLKFFKELGIDLVDFKIEFGRCDNEVLLGDEITPDGCRLWDAKTKEKLDKDRFRRDLGNVEQAYERVFKAVTGVQA